MIPAEEEEIFGVFDFVGQEEADGFQTLFSTIDVVTKKQIVGIRWETTIFK